jgi:hypothetical protein
LVEPEGEEPPPGFALRAADVLRIAAADEDFKAADVEWQDRQLRPERVGPLEPTAATRGEGLWEVRYRDPDDGEVEILVVVDDEAGRVIDVFTGTAIETQLARGYEGAVAGKANSWWIWLPLCLLFLAPFIDPTRAFRLLHLDLLALLGLSVSLYFFNRAEIGWSVFWVYPVLAYVLGRMLAYGFRPRLHGAEREGDGLLVPFASRGLLVAGVVALAIFHVGYQAAEGKVIDVGVASVIGADRFTAGEDVYGDEFGSELPERGDVRGDVYGPVNYLAYSPFELALPWEGSGTTCRRRRSRPSPSRC